MKTVSFLIAAYNEEKNIQDTIENILTLKNKFSNIEFEIIVINDGSLDKTGEIVVGNYSQNNLVIYHENKKNIGLGESIKKGIDLARFERFIFIPGDNDMPQSILISLLQSMDDADIIMTYFMNDEIRGRHRHIISSIFSLTYLYTFNIFLKYINGPAIYPTKRLKELTLESKRFSIVAEINVRLLKQGCSFKEIPSLRLRDTAESTALNFKSLIEVIRVYIHLVIDVYILNRSKYSNHIKRKF